MHMRTPFGHLVTFTEAGPFDTRQVPPSGQPSLPGNDILWRWTTDAVNAELLLGPYVPKLPPHMAVQGCWAAVWRMEALSDVDGASFSCRWDELPADADGGPSSGEGLDAQTWRMRGGTLSLGTEDEEYLAVRANRGDGMPARLASEGHPGLVAYLDGGLRVHFSSLRAGEYVQVQFVVAWTPCTDPYEVDTWFAVDQPHEEVLRQLRGSR